MQFAGGETVKGKTRRLRHGSSEATGIPHATL